MSPSWKAIFARRAARTSRLARWWPLRISGRPGMTNIEIGGLAGDARLAARGGGDLTVMPGSKNLTRDGLIISLRGAN